jgi:4-hydroxy-3-methylbut-2-enyl diphosphate reductase
MSAGPLFLAPLRLEAAALRRGAPNGSVELVGMGPARAASTCARLSAKAVPGRPIILAGVAGGLVAGLSAGDIVVASSLAAMTPEAVIELPAAAELAATLEGAGLRVALAPIFSSEKILHGPKARADAAATGATVVEMEARWLTPLMARHPFGVVRIVLDTLGADLISPATPRAAVRAYRALRDCAAALSDWAPANLSDPMTRSN